MTQLKAVIIPVTPFQQNCTLFWDPETMKGAVVDPGGDLDRIVENIEKNNVELEKILITHGHMDHAGGTLDLAERFGVPIEGPHKDDIFWIDKLEEAGKQYGIPGRIFTPDRWLEGNDTVTVGNLTLDVRHCPGHTPGHVIFYHEPSKLAIVGDVLFQGSIGRTDFPKGNHQQLLDSIKNELWPLGDEINFVPGHGQMSTFGHERKMNPFVSDFALSMEQD